MKVGILSDAHGNLAGFEAGLASLRAQAVDEFWFLGDAVGYIPDPGVVRRLLRGDVRALMGNHEDKLLSGDFGGHKDEVYGFRVIRGLLDDDDLAFIRGLPDHARVCWDGRSCLLVHGSPADYVYGYVYPDTPLGAFRNEAADVVFMGNTHRPFVRSEGGRLFVNVGSCGLPRDDSGLGSAAVYDTVRGEAHILHYSLAESARGILGRLRVHPSVARRLENMVSKGER